MKNASLTVVGSGIKFLSHLTTETKAYIEQSDVVLYLVNDPLMKEWIKKSNPNAESLDELYCKYPLRHDCYNAIRDYILEILKADSHVCVVMYGHPTVFAQSGLEAAQQAKKQGYCTKILPAVSAEDCLFADLLVDPSSSGCQSFEATDFLIYKRNVTPSSHLVLWQVGVIGALSHTMNHDNTIGIATLVDYLKDYYSLEHEVFVYEAAQYPSFSPRVEEVQLKDLPAVKLTRITTLYVPPAIKLDLNEAMLKTLKMDLENLRTQDNR